MPSCGYEWFGVCGLCWAGTSWDGSTFRNPHRSPTRGASSQGALPLEPTVGLRKWEYSQDMGCRGFCGECENIPRE